MIMLVFLVVIAAKGPCGRRVAILPASALAYNPARTLQALRAAIPAGLEGVWKQSIGLTHFNHLFA
jgi:hypothetical protein